MRDDFVIVARSKLGAGLAGERVRANRISVGKREKPYRGVVGGELRAQAADTPRPDNRHTELCSPHLVLLHRILSFSAGAAVAPSHR